MIALLETREKFILVWVIVDKLTKVAYFIPIKTAYKLERLEKLDIKEIIRLHGIPVTIVSNRDTRFAKRF